MVADRSTECTSVSNWLNSAVEENSLKTALPRDLVMYSTVTASSTVSRCCWHSVRARSIITRASAVKPAKARAMWLSETI